MGGGGRRGRAGGRSANEPTISGIRLLCAQFVYFLNTDGVMNVCVIRRVGSDHGPRTCAPPTHPKQVSQRTTRRCLRLNVFGRTAVSVSLARRRNGEEGEGMNRQTPRARPDLPGRYVRRRQLVVFNFTTNQIRFGHEKHERVDSGFKGLGPV